ncbi:MAG TPA: SMP-30/gluconolactonase/LRE family protein [Pirellulaceae bacterium]|nr:SMP-30/gluconolactonase/LRE family protein [Pirellulaceae bacterium]
MPTPLLLLAVFSADPTAEQIDLLKTFREEFVAITPGEGKFPRTFPFGANPRMEISRPFSIARYEVPQNLWEIVMGSNPSKWKGERNSVEMLSFDEAEQFCKKATEMMQVAGLIEKDQVIRLPYEREWEYACRAGTTTNYSFGDEADNLGDYAWFTGNAAGNDPPVGAKKANPWGLYDVHGYLWEWTDDEFGEAGGDSGSRMIRGGSWKDKTEDLASSAKKLVKKNVRDDAIGLRCVLAFVAAPLGDGPTKNFTPTAQAKVVPADSKLEKLWAEGEFTEGPALAPDGSILFSDIGTTIYRFDPKTGQTAVFRKPSGRSNGLKFNQKGELVACEGANTGGNRRISITAGIDGAKDGTVKTLAGSYDGKRFNSPNDLAIGSRGQVYFTDPRYVGDDPRDLDFETVFLVGTDGSVKVATRDIQKPNGIIVTPDDKTLYVSDNNPGGNRHFVRFAIQADGTLGGKKVLHDFGTGRGIDGMTLDRDGNIFATAGTGDKAGIYVFTAEGEHLAFIPTPGDPTNCCFGGSADSGTLYITCASSKEADTKYGLYRIKLNAKGFAVVKLK